jgi:hypothetical protein
MTGWRLLPECGTTPLRFDTEADLRKHLRTHYPDRKKTDVPGLFRIPSGGWVHCWDASVEDDE